MKKSIILVTIMLLSGVMVFGQEQRKKHGHRTGVAEHLKQELSLTDQQYASIKAINKSYQPKIETIRKSQSSDRQSKNNELQNLRKEKHVEISKVLTNEQNDQWQKLREKKRKDKRAGRARADEDKMERMKNSLSLSADQVSKIEKLHQERKSGLRSGGSETKSKNETKEQRQMSRDAYRSSMKEILTPDQFEKWKSMMKDKSEKRKHHLDHRR